MSRLQLFNFDDEYLFRLKKEAVRRYGTTYGSMQKLLYEFIDYSEKQSKSKPSFEALQKLPPTTPAEKIKKYGAVKKRYYDILQKIELAGGIEDHHELLMKLIKKTWKSKSLWEQKRIELIEMWNRGEGYE